MRNGALLDLAAEMWKAHQGDRAARGRLMRDALPIAANLVRPGTGDLVRKGLELLHDASAEDVRELGDGGQAVGNYEGFVERLLERPYGFYVAVGEPNTGKTTLALRLASRLVSEQGFRAIAVGGFHPDDRVRWHTDQWCEYAHPSAFLKAMRQVQAAMIRAKAYPRDIKRRVVLLDDASLIAHAGAGRFNRGLLQAINVYRHLDWVLVVTARNFKSLGTAAENADALFLKRPEWGALTTERPETLGWWRAADDAYRELKRTPDWRERPHAQQWVYVQAPRLRYTGMMPYGGPNGVDGDQVAEDLEPEAGGAFTKAAAALGAGELGDDDQDQAEVIDVTPRRRRGRAV